MRCRTFRSICGFHPWDASCTLQGTVIKRVVGSRSCAPEDKVTAVENTGKPHSPSSFWVVLNTTSVVGFREKMKAKALGFYLEFNLFNPHCIHTKRAHTVWFGGISLPPVSGWFLYPVLGLLCCVHNGGQSCLCDMVSGLISMLDDYFVGRVCVPFAVLMVWLWVEQYLLTRWILYRSTQ